MNAVADTFLTRALRDVCAKEGVDLPATSLASLVATANGDMRHALNTLQFESLGMPRRAAPAPKKGKRALGGGGAASSRSAGASRAAAAAQPATSSAGGERDKFPDMFHAIGSIITRPSKRVKLLAAVDQAAVTQSDVDDSSAFRPQEQCPPQSGSSGSSTESTAGVLPLQKAASSSLTTVDATFMPEDVIESSALDPPSAAAFLHQNYLEAFGEIAELASAADYLSDAHVLTDAQRRRPWQQLLLPYVASLAGRAVVTPNCHPAPPRFLQTRKPQVFQVERDALERIRRVTAAFRVAPDVRGGGGGFLDGGVNHDAASLALELVPTLRVLATSRGAQRQQQQLSLSHEQWKCVGELTSFIGGPPLPPQPQNSRLPAAAPLASAPYPHPTGGGGAPLRSAVVDDIEDD